MGNSRHDLDGEVKVDGAGTPYFRVPRSQYALVEEFKDLASSGKYDVAAISDGWECRLFCVPFQADGQDVADMKALLRKAKANIR